MRRVGMILVFVLALVASACAGSDPVLGEASTDSTAAGVADLTTTTEEHTDDEEVADEHADDEAAHTFWFGEPAEASASTRVIEIDANDDMSFGPSDLAVSVGETVTFRVFNMGVIPHDFTIGDEEMQDDHELEMSGGDMHEAEDPNAILVQPGETREITWTFTEPASLLIGCHVPGHWAAGMRGTLTIDG